LTLYLTDFLNRIFPGENAKNRDFSGEEKLKAAAVYLAQINQGAPLWKPVLCLRYLYPSPYPRPAPRADGDKGTQADDFRSEGVAVFRPPAAAGEVAAKLPREEAPLLGEGDRARIFVRVQGDLKYS
jgi:hypothetical protein